MNSKAIRLITAYLLCLPIALLFLDVEFWFHTVALVGSALLIYPRKEMKKEETSPVVVFILLVVFIGIAPLANTFEEVKEITFSSYGYTLRTCIWILMLPSLIRALKHNEKLRTNQSQVATP